VIPGKLLEQRLESESGLIFASTQSGDNYHWPNTVPRMLNLLTNIDIIELL
jgi:hypothetical protein